MADSLSQHRTDSTSQLCSVCHRNPQKYACPRCSIRTCSLPCSTGHKVATGCSGERNKAAYVPMNAYSWGTMMNDYVFLEDIGQHVGEWGREIVKGGFTIARKSRGVPGHHPRSRSFQSSKTRAGGKSYSKRDMLRTQFEARQIDMDLLPAGMERQKLNKSYWDSKTHTAFLSIELKIYPPRDPFRPSTQPLEPPYVLLTHRNNTQTPLLTLTRQILGRARGATPSWAKQMVLPDPDDPESFAPPHFVMPAHVGPSCAISEDNRAYYRFDPNKMLADLLRNTHFVEFPTIEVWEEFKGRVVNAEGTVKERPASEEPSPKRRKFTAKAGMRAINGLLNGYGSDEGEQRPQSSLAMLGGYAESDVGDTERDDDDGGGVSDDALIDSEDEDDVKLSPSALLELIRQVRGSDEWQGDVDHAGTSGDEEWFE